jgi:hypothetical protein
LFDGACSFADPADPAALAASILAASAATVAPATCDELRRTHSWAMVAHRIESTLEGVRRGT